MALEGASRYIDSISLFKPDERRRLFQPDVARLAGCDASTSALTTECGESAGHWLSRLQQWDLGHYLPLDILTKVDRMSMAHSIETRVPLLDHVLVEFAATIPPRLQRAGGESKHVFKRAMRGLLPDEIIDRPKQGFAVPLGAWFRGGLEGTLRDVLLADRGRSRGIFEPRYVRQLLA
ncbi:exosortase 1 system-associated amidotransferase 1, partial [mine drainage metagenome]